MTSVDFVAALVVVSLLHGLRFVLLTALSLSTLHLLLLVQRFRRP